MVYLVEDIVDEWHPTLNDSSDYHLSKFHLRDKAWWVGKCGHTWNAMIGNRNRLGTGCPYCAGQRCLKGFNDIDTTHHFLAEIWSSKNEYPSSNYSHFYKKLVWWLEKCGHEYQLAPARRVWALRCQVCVNRVIIPGFNDLATLRPKISSEWHTTKNGDLKPTQVSVSKNLKIWWECKLGHEWFTSINSRTSKQNTNCPTCTGRTILSGFNDLQTTHPEVAVEWHPTKNGDLLPTHISQGNSLPIWWLCGLGHEYQAVPYSRTSKKTTGCAVCAGKRLLTGLNDIATLYPLLVSEWHPIKNGNLLPSEVASKSGKKAWWLCVDGHEWETAVSNRSAGKGCRKCHSASHSSKAEKEVKVFVASLGYIFEGSDRKVLNGKELDLFFPDLNFAIEYNGLYWHAERHKPKSYHFDKYSECDSYGVVLYQIWEDDWIFNQDVVKADIAQKLLTRNNFVNNVFLSDKLAKDTTVTDNTSGEDYLYAASFVKLGIIEPDYKLLWRHRLVMKFPVDFFESEVGLLFEDGLTVGELEDLNNIERVWDAGKTMWKRVN